MKLAHQPMEGFPRVAVSSQSCASPCGACHTRQEASGRDRQQPRCSSLDACGENNETSVRGSNATRRVERSGRGTQGRRCDTMYAVERCVNVRECSNDQRFGG